MTDWNYTGDMNLEEGGLFWKEDGSDDYVLAVEITPCRAAGGPDNLFHIQSGSIFIPSDRAKLLSALSMGGYTMRADGAIIDCTGGVMEGPQARDITVEMMNAYWGFDDRQEHVVRIGKADPDSDPTGWSPEPDYEAHGNTKIRTYVENHFLD